MYQSGEELESLEPLQLTEGLTLPEGLSVSAELENLVVEEKELQGELHEVTQFAMCIECILQKCCVHIYWDQA